MNIKKIIMFFLLLGVLLLYTQCVFAAEAQISIDGAQTANVSETKILTVKISADEEIGVVSGKIDKNSNVSEVKATAQNGWTLTYNAQTGVFNIYKAEGAKSEVIMSIECTVGSSEGAAKIALTNIKMTTINYETISKENLIKTINVIKEEVQNPPEQSTETENKKEPNKPSETIKPSGNTNNNQNTLKPSDNTNQNNQIIETSNNNQNKIVFDNRNDKTTNTNLLEQNQVEEAEKQENTRQDVLATESNNEIIKKGNEEKSNSGLIACITILGVIAIVIASCIIYKKQSKTKKKDNTK